MHPLGVTRRALGAIPVCEHLVANGNQALRHLRCRRVDGQLEAVAARVEEVDRLADDVVGRPDDLDPVQLELRLVYEERLLVGHAQRQMLNPCRGVLVAPHRR